VAVEQRHRRELEDLPGLAEGELRDLLLLLLLSVIRQENSTP
jgi:hypothetical protein